MLWYRKGEPAMRFDRVLIVIPQQPRSFEVAFRTARSYQGKYTLRCQRAIEIPHLAATP
jgi:hypothetical protein